MNPFLPSRWRTSVFLVLLLALWIFYCTSERPDGSGGPHPRTTEARLSGFEVWRSCKKQRPDAGPDLEAADCGPSTLSREVVSLTVSECDDRMNDAMAAVRLLAGLEQCTDPAVEKLEMLAAGSADAMLLSDLAGAYYVRAQRQNRPSDLVRSLATADRAVAQASSSIAARFNRAIALEALGLTDEAIRSWDVLRKEAEPAWAGEAADHFAWLMSSRSRKAATRWELNRQRLPVVAAAGDRAAVRALVTPYHNAAQRYVEEELLGAWARSSGQGRAEEAARALGLAEMIATALGDLERDRYLLEGVRRIRETSDSRILALLREGHLALQSGRASAVGPAAATAYERAEAALKAAGSPLRLGAALGRAATLTIGGHFEVAADVLLGVEREAQGRYPSVIARVHSGRGFRYMIEGRSIDALSEYKKAQTIFKAIGDLENVSTTQNSIIGLYRRVGHTEFTWRAVFQDRQRIDEIVGAQARHSRYGEMAASALALGCPTVALRYQNLAVQLLEDELSRAPEGKLELLRRNRGIAVLRRAEIRLKLGDLAGARADLDEAKDLVSDERDKELETGFRAILAELDGQLLAGSNRKAAIGALSAAIQLGGGTRYRALVASFVMQRAELYRLEGNRAAMTADLERVAALLRDEEVAALTSREEKGAELLWSAYFSRDQDVYRRLIERHIENGADTKAFDYAERARAYEPLHLLLERNELPDGFRRLIRGREPLGRRDVERILPPGTVLLQYAVLDDRTYVWIVTSAGTDRRMLPVGERQIHSWTRALQRFASLRDDERFERALAAPSRVLMAEPLGLIAKSRRAGETTRLVIIPDRSMHGLPFAALKVANRYLMQDHVVSVAGSSTLYAFSLEQDRQRSDGQRASVRLFADPAFQAGEVTEGLKRLPAARSEAARIASLYSPVADVVPPIMDAEATVPEFLRRAAESTILHVAAHGVADPDVPPWSFLLMAPYGSDPGLIDAERLLKKAKLKRTRLAVLSACSSAGGTPVGPEGLAPLVRPLIVAGVPGVIGTLWNVSDDAATEDLLVRFHQHYRDGQDAAEALRNAQREMLAGRSSIRPVRSWAAFQMIGYASSPFAASADETRRTK
jgi:CHAT domain-containing protein